MLCDIDSASVDAVCQLELITQSFKNLQGEVSCCCHERSKQHSVWGMVYMGLAALACISSMSVVNMCVCVGPSICTPWSCTPTADCENTYARGQARQQASLHMANAYEVGSGTPVWYMQLMKMIIACQSLIAPPSKPPPGDLPSIHEASPMAAGPEGGTSSERSLVEKVTKMRSRLQRLTKYLQGQLEVLVTAR